MKAVIMAGGEGTRLRPLTCNVPKPMVPVANRPVMKHIVDLGIKHGIRNLAVTLQYLPGVIRRYFGDGTGLGVNMKYFVEEKPLGTAGSVRNASEYLDETFIVISGDAITDIDINEVLRFHSFKKAMVTLVLKKVDIPLEYGVVITDGDGRVGRFVEKPGWGEVFSDIANTGIYVMSPEIFNYIEKGKKLDFSKDIFPRLLEMDIPVYGYKTDRYWCDIGDVGAYLDVHRDILDGRIVLDNLENRIDERVWMGTGCSISRDVIFEGPCIIGNNNIIGKNVRIGAYSVLGDNNYIGAGAIADGSVIWNRCLIEPGCKAEDTIICSKAFLGGGAIACSNSVIGEGAYIGKDACVRTGIKVWPEKRVEEGMELSFNIVKGNRSARRFFAHDISGRIDTDMTPEYSSRLGAAFSSAFPGDEKFVVGYDGGLASMMIKDSIRSGILSTGAELHDLGKTALPMIRTAVCFFSCRGGMYVRKESGGKGTLAIDFIDENGLNIARDMERKIDGMLSRDEYKRASVEKVKEIRYMHDYTDIHYRTINNSINSENIDMKVVALSGQIYIIKALERIFREKGCTFEIDKSKRKGNFPGCNRVAETVKRGKFDLGTVLDYNPEKIVLIDEKGRFISGDELTALIAMVYFHKNNGGSIIAPIYASDALEKIAMNYNGKVIRKKNIGKHIVGFDVENGRKQNAYEQMAYLYDPVACLLKVMDFMQETGISLNGIMNSLPKIHMSERRINCPWDRKGVVIKGIIEEHNGQKMETIEGVKLYKEKGWVLVLPDNEEPVCNIISEGATQEFAEELTGVYAEKVKKYMSQHYGN